MMAEISVNNQQLEVVTSFEYLGSLITSNGDTLNEIKRRTSITLQKQLKKVCVWTGNYAGYTPGTSKEGMNKKNMGSGYHRQFSNKCIGCGTSCVQSSGLQKGC